MHTRLAEPRPREPRKVMWKPCKMRNGTPTDTVPQCTLLFWPNVTFTLVAALSPGVGLQHRWRESPPELPVQVWSPAPFCFQPVFPLCFQNIWYFQVVIFKKKWSRKGLFVLCRSKEGQQTGGTSHRWDPGYESRPEALCSASTAWCVILVPKYWNPDRYI